MDNESIEITLNIPVSLYQELAIEAEKNTTGISHEILTRLQKTFGLDELEKELQNDIHLLKEEVKESHEHDKIPITSPHDIKVQNEELRMMMAKMDRLQKDLVEIKTLVRNKLR